MTRRLALAILSCAALLAGCGGGGGGGEAATLPGPDPATLAPANAPLFAESVVRPEGSQRDDLQGALSKLLATDDPGGFLVERLDSELASSNAGITYADDIEPWLGPRAAIFFDSFTDQPDGAAIVASTDPSATQAAVDKAAAADKQPEKKATYKGQDYLVDPDGTAVGVVGEFLVAGSEQGFHEAVDASQGSSIADSGDFKARLGELPSGGFAFAYADPKAIVDALEKSGQLTASELSAAGPQIQSLLSGPVAMYGTATPDELGLQVSSAANSAAPSPQESPLLESLPADSWFAFASSDAGKTIGEALSQIPALPPGVPSDLGTQLSHWAGDVGGFMRGTSVLGIGGALILETSDEAASAKTLGDVQSALSGNPAVRVSPLGESGEQGFALQPASAPVQFQLVQKDGKVVAGLADSVSDVFSPSSRLGDSDRFKAATAGLGDFAPVSFVDFGPLFQLLDGIPDTADDPGYQQAKPYLDHLDYLALGARSESGGRSGTRVVLGLKDASSSSGATTTP